MIRHPLVSAFIVSPLSTIHVSGTRSLVSGKGRGIVLTFHARKAALLCCFVCGALVSSPTWNVES